MYVFGNESRDEGRGTTPISKSDTLDKTVERKGQASTLPRMGNRVINPI